MAKREYSFYPGCSSQKGASSSNYLVSVQTMCEELDIQLNEIPDWNCCSASIGYAGGGELPRLALSARNIALSEEHNPGQEIVATCAACWLATRETQERLQHDEGLLAETNTALAEAGPDAEERCPDQAHGRGPDPGHRLRRHRRQGQEAARRHQDRRLRRLSDQPPVRYRRRELREPEIPGQAGRDPGCRLGPGLREKGAMLRRRAGLLRAGEVAGR